MHRILIAFLLVALMCGGAAFVLYHAHGASASDSPRTAVIADEQSGAIRFVIDGQEVARFAPNGLHVRNDMLFGGVITDVGPAAFDNLLDELPTAGGNDAP